MHTPGFWRSSFSRKAREMFCQCCASCGTCERLRQACLFVCPICMLVRYLLKLQTFSSFLVFKLASFLVLETSLSSLKLHPFVLIFSTSTLPLICELFQDHGKDELFIAYCIHFMFFLQPRESVQAFQDGERGESSSVAVSRVEPCLPTGFYILSLEDGTFQLHLIYPCARQYSPDEEPDGQFCSSIVCDSVCVLLPVHALLLLYTLESAHNWQRRRNEPECI